jgi:hypothetical protein
MPESKYGDKVNAIRIGRYDDGGFKYVYLPLIEVNNEMCSIDDDSTVSGCIECENKSQAIKTAKVTLQKFKTLEANND